MKEGTLDLDVVEEQLLKDGEERLKNLEGMAQRINLQISSFVGGVRGNFLRCFY